MRPLPPTRSCDALAHPGAIVALAGALFLSGCGSSPRAPVIERNDSVETRSGATAARTAPGTPGRGGYYKDDGPGDSPPPDLDKLADAQPRVEPLHRFANNPYNVFGQDYAPMRSLAPFRQSGIASWYGRKFHGQRTSSGEVYDMYGMTAAHPTLPIPSYVRVSNQQNGRSVIVRVNDRGPFHAGRIIDLSFAAAFKLGYAIAGSTPVQVELLTAEDIARLAAPQPGVATAPATTAVTTATVPAQAPTTRTPQDAPAAPATPAPPREAVAVAPAAGVYLQLGAFSARDNAETFRARVYREVAWLNDGIEIQQRDGIYRLHLGPYRDRSEAGSMAERLKRDLDLTPVYVTR